MKIVYFGTPQFAANTLQFLLDNKVNIVAVITKPDRPKGRSGNPIPTPVKIVAESNQIPFHQPELVSAIDFAETLKGYEADLFVVVAYGEIIKQHILDMPPKGCINVHASLLPKYRGAAPIQRSIINGEKETGITIMYMVKKMDAGDIIQMEKVEITADMTYGELEKELCDVGSIALLEVIHRFEKGDVPREEQDHSRMTLAPKIELEDCEIKWSEPAENIHNLVRGVNPFPGAWCNVVVRDQKKRLKVISTKLLLDTVGVPGVVLERKNGLIVGCAVGAIQILELQLEGKKAMTAIELMRGINDIQFIYSDFTGK